MLEAHVQRCPQCTVELFELRETAALLALGSEALFPDPGLRVRVLERIGRERFGFVLSSEGAWVDQGGGLQIKQLFLGSDGSRTSLVALPARMPVSRAYHQGDLGYVVIRGELESEGVRLGAGGLLPGAGGDRGSEAAALTETVLLAVSARPGDTLTGSPTARPAVGKWKELEPGALILPLGGSVEGLQISLMRMTPGAKISRHKHEEVEELCLISGDCRCQGVEVGPEDYHRASPGTTHEATTTVGGCTMVYITRVSG